MMLFWGVLGVTVSVVLFAMLFVSERNPRPTIWKSDFLAGSILVPGIVGAGIIGFLLVVRYFMDIETRDLYTREPLMAAGVALAGAVVLKAMRIKTRLARFKAQGAGAGATIIPMEKPTVVPEPPVIDRRAA